MLKWLESPAGQRVLRPVGRFFDWAWFKVTGRRNPGG